jgi:hypothetical protein
MIVKPINKLLKKNTKFEWTSDIQKDFIEIKNAITINLVLISLDFEKGFILYSFTSEETISSILTQKNDKVEELPIAFLSKTLHDYELKYSMIEKQALSLVKEIAHFMTYILLSNNWLAKLQLSDL